MEQPVKADKSREWTTASELSFLSGLGLHAPHVHTDRHDLFKKYAVAMRSRAQWGNIDTERIAEFVRDVIRGENTTWANTLKN